MAFSDFKYPACVAELGLTEETDFDLFTGVPPVEPAEGTRLSLRANAPLALGAHSEAARAIWLAGPILADAWFRYRGRLSLNPGVEFEADPPAKLTGYCDFVFSRGPQRPVIGPPVLLVFEAKRDSIPDALGQAIAALVGAQRYNRREGTPIDPLYGCATTGDSWKFFRLTGTTLTVDLTEYNLSQVDRLIGVLIHILGPVPG